jgi:phospholipid/cholesterol/gamma-HCH transport system ATP-binding protein
MICATDIHKAFGEKVVLNGVSADFKPGQVNFIIGRSGSGKSVLTKCLVGLLEVDRGLVTYSGPSGDKDFTAMRPREREVVRHEIGMLFQGGALFDSMTVRENVMFPLTMFANLDPVQMEHRVQECLQRVELGDSGQFFPAEISGGMQKRVALARSIVMRPRFLFCDEPNSGLDPQTAIVIDTLIRELTHEYETTTVVVSHDMNSVIEIGEHIHFVHDGDIPWTGDSADILRAELPALEEFVYASDLMKDVRKKMLGL